MGKCFVCERISAIKNGSNKFFVKEMESSYVVLGDYQYYRGYTLLLSKTHASELHELNFNVRKQFLEDMALVAEAVFRVFKPKKLNYELLGNTHSHMHWHIIPRYEDDPKPDVPIWVIPKSVIYSKSMIPTDSDLSEMKDLLLSEIIKRQSQIK